MRFTLQSREEILREKIAIRESMLTYARKNDRKRVAEHEAALVTLRGWLRDAS